MSSKCEIDLAAIHLLHDNVLVTDLDRGPHKTAGGLLIPDDNMSERGIRDRWARVYAVGPDVTDLQVGEWVLIKHGKWTPAIDLNYPDETVRVWRIDYPESVLLVTDQDPREHATTSL